MGCSTTKQNLNVSVGCFPKMLNIRLENNIIIEK